MMSSKAEAGKKIGENAKDVKLLREIESISKGLYIDKSSSSPRSSSSRPNTARSGKAPLPDSKPKVNRGNEVTQSKDKKSLWNWRSFKAFSRSRRFNCCFSLQVHSIEGLPSNFSDLSLCVHWKRRDGELVTRPAKVRQGKAEFEEKLMQTCSVHGSRSGPHHSAKYEAKHFLLYAAVYNVPDLDMGKHRVDLTRLLPLTLEELEEDRSSGSWTTSFKLTGKAKGAIMTVSFGYLVVGNGSGELGKNQKVAEVQSQKQNTFGVVKQVPRDGQADGRSAVMRSESLPSNFDQQNLSATQSVDDVKDLHEVLPPSRSAEDASSVDMSQQKLNEVRPGASDECIRIVDELYADTESMSQQKLNELRPGASDEYKRKADEFNAATESILSNLDSFHVPGDQNVAKECEGVEFSVTEKGIELASKEEVKSVEVIMKDVDVSVIKDSDTPVKSTDIEYDMSMHVFPEEGDRLTEVDGISGGELVLQSGQNKEDEKCTKESLMEELESALSSVTKLETAALDFPDHHTSNMESEHDIIKSRIIRSHSLDDVANLESEFLNMLGIEHSPFGPSSEPDSPRERLLQEFERETQATGFPLFDFDMEDADLTEHDCDASTFSGWNDLSEDFELSSMIQVGEKELEIAAQAANSKTNAKLLEDLETEALMRQWGINEKAFQSSPPRGSGGFGSPIDLPPQDPVELPLLADGLGPFIQTKNGGFLRTMNPELFTNTKSGGSLIMQVSSPVVVPAAMGSNIMEILQRLVSVGIEKLSMQANQLMPLEDITGKRLHQVAREATPTIEEHERQYLYPSGGEKGKNLESSRPRSNKCTAGPVSNQVDSDFASLQDLAPLAMDKIEALSLEGLRIQSGFSDEDAPSNISARSIGEISTLHGKGIGISGTIGLEGTAGLQLLDIKDNGDEIDGLMGLSLTLDDWMRLDSGEFDDGDEISEQTAKILAAHHAASLDFLRGKTKGEKKRSKASGRKCGLLGNNFTVALMVQLRDPLRNYEAVGTPMLSLIQVERVFMPTKPRIYRMISEVKRNGNGEDEESVVKESPEEKEIPLEESIPQYKITEVHMAGLKTEPGKKTWGKSTQQQSGSRWLLANGMGKSNKHPLMRAKAVSKSPTPMTTKAQPGDTLWSISSRIFGTKAKSKELTAQNPHIRNPNIILPNENSR